MKNALAMLAALVFAVLVVGCADAQTSSARPTPTASVADQVTQALSHEASPELLVLPVGTDAVLIHQLGSTDEAGQAETISVAVNLASAYEELTWKADITGLSSVTVVVALEDYQNGDGTTSTQDVVKAIVTSGTGTSLSWDSGTPAQRFQQFDVHWKIGQGSEP